MAAARRSFPTMVIASSLFAITLLGQNYQIDTRYAGTSLAGWHVVGDATWRATGGEYIGTPKTPTGGWLMLDTSLQDVGVFATFRCTGGCKTGVLLRAEKTGDGIKGIYVALAGEDAATYRVTLDASGKELSREPLRPAGGQARFAPPPAPDGAPQGRGRGGRGARGSSPTG